MSNADTFPLSRGNARDELIAITAIMRAGAISPERLTAALDYVGSAVELLPESLGGDAVEASSLVLAGLQLADVARARADVGRWERDRLDVRTVLDPTYPSNLQAVADKPPFVFVQGTFDEMRDGRAVAVVGTRAASEEGCKRAMRLAVGLAKAGITVVSGLAVGVDRFAHLGALRAKGRTIAVMGTGLRRRYPAQHAPLADDIIAAGGALISQFFPEQPPTKWTFPKRNVTMSGLSLATVVVEAGPTSGAKMQAEAALKHGRAVFLPTSLVSSHAWARAMVERGVNDVRAVEVVSIEDLVDRLELSPESLPLLSA